MMWFCVLLLSIWVFYGDACTTTGMPQPGSDVRPQGAEKDRVTAEASAPGIVELLAWGLVLLDMEQERMLGKPGRFGRHSQGAHRTQPGRQVSELQSHAPQGHDGLPAGKWMVNQMLLNTAVDALSPESVAVKLSLLRLQCMSTRP